ncbi:hypothetical protein PTTG_26985 [Puccinia triticina 1-1 BBBD Race 1]|uniref:Uncharacterized protein n=1 Tax=Puccinia triticina (isolate 1-1 / race 1 (BBBD)) TaxID=630390 RepID=A0A180GPC9_PUCT1|nr:hypothetical protein PTTG_26985 [Puccinia triticina 1-1 BBBD Race 1]
MRQWSDWSDAQEPLAQQQRSKRTTTTSNSNTARLPRTTCSPAPSTTTPTTAPTSPPPPSSPSPPPPHSPAPSCGNIHSYPKDGGQPTTDRTLALLIKLADRRIRTEAARQDAQYKDDNDN